MTAAPEPAGLYLHVPFCSAICPYCDFAVRIGRAPARAAFVDVLIAEIALWVDWVEPIDTVYLGGGTPSILAPADLARLLNAVRDSLPLVDGARFFLETNPEDVSPERAAQWCDLGVKTISLGVQSFDDAELKFLGRRHDGAGARAAVNTCRRAGFSTVSLDLIFGLPGQRDATLADNLANAVDLGVDHVSCYQLTVHDGTTFGRRRDRGKLCEMPEGDQAERYHQVHQYLATNGFEAYEVSNFARTPAHRSRHNRKYWRHVPYLGLGPSAHSFDGASRWWNQRDADDYAEMVRAGQRPIAGREQLTRSDLALETVMFGLRTIEGIDLHQYRERFEADLLSCNRTLVDACIAHGQLRLVDRRLVPTAAGLAIADGLATRFETG